MTRKSNQDMPEVVLKSDSFSDVEGSEIDFLFHNLVNDKKC